jgi:hypothetical protein
VIVHVRQSRKIEAIVVRPLLIVCNGAIVGDIRSIVDLVTVKLEEYRIAEPVPLLLCPINESAVASVSSQLRGEEEETAVRGNVLVIVAIVECEHLPSETTVAIVVPAICLSIEHRLCHSSPRRRIVARCREVEFCGVHCRKGPEDLIIVSFALTLVRWNETLTTFRTSLVYNSLDDFVVVCGVSSVCVTRYVSPATCDMIVKQFNVAKRNLQYQYSIMFMNIAPASHQ